MDDDTTNIHDENIDDSAATGGGNSGSPTPTIVQPQNNQAGGGDADAKEASEPKIPMPDNSLIGSTAGPAGGNKSESKPPAPKADDNDLPKPEPVIPSPSAKAASKTEDTSQAPKTGKPAGDKTPGKPDKGDKEELRDVKKQALEQLTPLVSHLDLPPQKKFDTLMMIIRASDDPSLIKPAFDAAQSIDDEDKKAQALLDVVNEVNYLTQDSETDKK